MVDLKPGDVFFTRGKSTLNKMVRFFTRSVGEPRTKVDHIGLVVGAPDTVVEALARVQQVPLGNRKAAVYRPLNLTEEEIALIVTKARSYVGKKYSYIKVTTHFLDWLLQGAYVFRRLGGLDPYPICSYLVAESFSAAGKNFGVSPGAASPDDCWDFVNSRPDKYQQVVPLEE